MKRMSRKEIVDIVGLGIVVASLIIVAWELHEVGVATKITSRNSITDGHLEFMGALIDEDVLPTAIWKTFSNREDELSDFERFQISVHNQRRWQHYERVYYLWRLDVLTDSEWDGFRATITASMTEDDAFATSSRESFKELRNLLSEDFVMYVTSLKDSED